MQFPRGRTALDKSSIRVLVVDDSVVIRKLLSDALSGDPALEVVGTASDGRIALAKIPQLKPDLITLDIEMPVMNGLETLAAIRKLYPKLPVIMFSTLTEHGAAATLDALSLGASDYATKTSNTGSLAVAAEAVHHDLIPKIKALCGVATLEIAPLVRPRPALKVPLRLTPASKLWPSALRPEARTLWRKSCRESRKTSLFRLSWCSTCRPFLPGCWRNDFPAALPFP